MTERKRTSFVGRLEWRVCRHRRTRTRPLPLQGTTMPDEEYCGLAPEQDKPILQWCQMDNCPHLDRVDVP